ncbi:MAG TPA: sec-independent translocase [Streptosporangiaceae bacterium]
MFDVGFGEFLVLGVLALVIFGDKLPTVAAQAGRALRQMRQMAMSAKQDLQEGLGPDFADFDPADLHPRRFVQKHLFSDPDDEPTGVQVFEPPKTPDWDDSLSPPFDREAT